MLTNTENLEQSPVNLGRLEIRCPMGFTVREVPASANPIECGHACCYPAACARLKLMAEQLKEEPHVHVD